MVTLCLRHRAVRRTVQCLKPSIMVISMTVSWHQTPHRSQEQYPHYAIFSARASASTRLTPKLAFLECSLDVTTAITMRVEILGICSLPLSHGSFTEAHPVCTNNKRSTQTTQLSLQPGRS